MNTLLVRRVQKLFGKAGAEQWWKTYNLVFDGACPEDLLRSPEGLSRLDEEVSKMEGHSR